MPAPVDDAEEQIAQLADERVRCRLMRVAAGVTLERRVDLLELLEHLGAHCASVRPVKTDARGAPAQLRRARERGQRPWHTGQHLTCAGGCRSRPARGALLCLLLLPDAHQMLRGNSSPRE